MIKRTQLKRSDYKILGVGETEPKNPQNSDNLSNYYEYIYDDNDFYQEMLKELVESRIADSGNLLLFLNY